ncbi:MAG: hypothetical protein WBD18_04395, partial [Phycisphaerae bacterium]
SDAIKERAFDSCTSKARAKDTRETAKNFRNAHKSFLQRLLQIPFFPCLGGDADSIYAAMC